MADNDLPLYKIVMVGESRVGKTCILNRFLDVEPRADQHATIGVEFGSKIVRNHLIEAKLQIWDTAGQQRYRAISAAYYRKAVIVIFVFDVTNLDSFNNLPTWIDEAKKNISPEDKCQFILIGNKIDLEDRKVSTYDAEAFAAERNIRYIEVSAIADIHIGNAMELICELLSDKEMVDTSPGLSTKNVEEEKWKTKMLSLIDHVHDVKIHQIYQIYSPIIKVSAPKLLEAHFQEELFRITDDQQLWHKIINAIQFGVREVIVNLTEISQVLQISMILECSVLKKYAMAQLVRILQREKLFNVLPNLVKLPFMNENHKRAVLQYLYQVPASAPIIEKVRAVVDEETFADFQIWKNKPKELSPLLEMDSEKELKMTAQERFLSVAQRLLEHRDLTGDLVLKSGGSDENNPAFSVKVHKLVVAARCDYINSCLNSNLKEASEGVIEIKGFNQEELNALVEYFYTNSYEHIANPNTCVSILSMASYLMLAKETNPSVNHTALLNALEKTVMDDITDDTCLDLVLNAHKNQDNELKRIAIKYITDNYFNVSTKHEDQFSKLPKALIFTIMNKMFFKISGGAQNNNNN